MKNSSLVYNLNRLIVQWNEQGINPGGLSNIDIEKIETKKNVKLPKDFKEYYSMINGMGSYYPNETDAIGFLFYPLEEVATLEEALRLKNIEISHNTIYIFADYMQKSWWYGFRLNQMNDKYEIGIVAYEDQFKIITDSLSTFIDLYLSDSSILYDYTKD